MVMGTAGGHEDDALQIEGRSGLFRYEEMSDVDRIKSGARLPVASSPWQNPQLDLNCDRPRSTEAESNRST